MKIDARQPAHLAYPRSSSMDNDEGHLIKLLIVLPGEDESHVSGDKI
jgi:hypothetical protein